MSSCMNAGNIGIPNSVWNSSWNGLATQTGLEKATEKITGTVDKASQRITDAIAKIKTTANSEQPVPVTPGVKVFHDALKGISLAASRVADEVLGNPNEAKAAIESASSIAQQFSDLTVSAKQTADDNERLLQAATEATETSKWVAGNLRGGYQCVSVGNLAGRMRDFS